MRIQKETKDRRERQAEGRRRAFRNFMLRHNLVPAEWARISGLSNPNAIYNFLSGRAHSLSPETLQRLADSLPGVMISDILGETERKAPQLVSDPKTELETVVVKSMAKASLWRRMYEVPSADQVELTVVKQPIPIDEAILVADESCDKLYPVGSYALIVRVDGGNLAPSDGDAVVVVRSRKRGSITEREVTIRELQVQGKKKAAIVWQSTNPEYQGEVQVPWPFKRQEFSNEYEPDSDTQVTRYEIVGIVVGAQMLGRRKKQ